MWRGIHEKYTKWDIGEGDLKKMGRPLNYSKNIRFIKLNTLHFDRFYLHFWSSDCNRRKKISITAVRENLSNLWTVLIFATKTFLVFSCDVSSVTPKYRVRQERRRWKNRRKGWQDLWRAPNPYSSPCSIAPTFMENPTHLSCGRHWWTDPYP